MLVVRGSGGSNQLKSMHLVLLDTIPSSHFCEGGSFTLVCQVAIDGSFDHVSDVCGDHFQDCASLMDCLRSVLNHLTIFPIWDISDVLRRWTGTLLP